MTTLSPAMKAALKERLYGRFKVVSVPSVSCCGACGWNLRVEWDDAHKEMVARCLNSECEQAGLVAVLPSYTLGIIESRPKAKD